MAKTRKLPDLALLTSTIESARAPENAEPTGQILTIRLDELWLDHQPREIIPEERLQELIAAGHAQPAALLAILRDVAADDPYYQEILEKLDGLARSIASEGILQPIQVVPRGGRPIVRDGHRRCLASLLAGAATVPAVYVEEPGEIEGIARALIVNLQREDLTALEKGAALLRLALLVARHLASGDETPLGLDALLGTAVEESAEPDGDGVVSTTVTGHSRARAAAVRERVCAMTGLQPRSYYRLLALNRLVPEARALARGLSENQLRPVLGLGGDDQVEVLGFARRRGLSSKEITSLAQVVRGGDRDAVRRIMARLAREEGSRQRATVSWEPLLHAVPRDLWQRCQALRSELEALPPDHRQVRLAAMAEQSRLLLALHEEFEQILQAHSAGSSDEEN